jgi:hypothetical protein
MHDALPSDMANLWYMMIVNSHGVRGKALTFRMVAVALYVLY